MISFYNNMNPEYIPLAATALKLQQIPMFLFILLEFGGVCGIHKHQSSKILCQNSNNSSMKMPVYPKLHIHRKHAYKFHTNKSV